MRILHIGKYHPPFHGGIENFMADLMEEQTALGHHVMAIVHHHQSGKPFSKKQHGEGMVYRVPIHGVLAFVPIAPTFGRQLANAINAFEPDIIHMHMPNVSCFWALLTNRAQSVPWVIHWHSDVLGAAPDWRIRMLYPFYRVFERALLKRSEQVICTSQNYLDSSKPLQDFKDKCRVIPLGIKDLNSAISCQVPDSLTPLKLLCIGRLTYYKGHEILIQAVEELKRLGIQIRLTIVGIGVLEQPIESQIEKLGLQQQINMVGSVSNEELNQYMQSTDLLCLPSIERTEAFGVVLLEAMRMGKPCLATNVQGSGMSWVVQDDLTGVVTKVSSVQSLKDSLNRLNQHRERLTVMGQNGRKRFEQVFTIEAVAKAIDVCYQDTLNLGDKAKPL